jgi:hypothetical protein
MTAVPVPSGSPPLTTSAALIMTAPLVQLAGASPALPPVLLTLAAAVGATVLAAEAVGFAVAATVGATVLAAAVAATVGATVFVAAVGFAVAATVG